METMDSKNDIEQNRKGNPVNGPKKNRVTDRMVNATLLWLFPRNVRPNHLTIARFILTPIIIVLLAHHHHALGFIVFCAAVCTDFIDGAMARIRLQISKVGMIIDPIADKLLIGSVLAFEGYNILVVQIILAFIALELISMALGIALGAPGKRIRPANVFGKAKMVIQSIAVTMFLVAGIFSLHTVKTISTYLLWAALLFAALSGVNQTRDAIAAHRARASTG